VYYLYIYLFICLAGLRSILSDVLGIFWIRKTNLMLNTKNFWSLGILGPSITTLKLKYLLNMMCMRVVDLSLKRT